MTNDQTANNGGSQTRDHGFLIGLITGGVVGAGLTMLLAPRVVAELRQRVTDSARTLGRAASDRYQQTSARASEAADELTKRGQGIRDEVLEAVVSGAQKVESGAQKVERFATDRTTSRRQAK
jgi:gas vesicle protein